MKFTANKELLAKLVADCASATQSKGTMPILANLKLELDQGRLTITATDLEIQISGSIEVDQVESGSITIPAKKFGDIIKNVTGEIDFKVEHDTNDGAASNAIIKSGRSRFSLQTLPSQDFPDIQATDTNVGFTCNSGAFTSALHRVQHAMANQDVRYYLNGILVELSPDEIVVVATDGHRMVKTSLDAKKNKNVSEMIQYIIPRKSVLELGKIANQLSGDLTILFSSNHVHLKTENRVVISKLIDGKFPDYRRVIPTLEHKISIDRIELRNAFQRVAITSNEKFRGIRVDINKVGLTLKSTNPDKEEGEETIPCPTQLESTLTIGINANYINDALQGIAESDVSFSFSNENTAMMFESSNNTASVLMPIRL